ncbi:HK97 family phage prohead protease [Echinicola sp. 20G]|uniref:HK97 family phage prohead protease n=1 Tax=Echinicola sp. 20G TaxID=2781961 RepID=UPI0019110C8D|nr:HK97 family phage prohead protease [Echinicola sp. 20G]
MNKEIRTFSDIEFRATEEEDKKYISGYALKFNTRSKDLGGFYETISREAINEQTDLSDVVALFNHNQNYVLARKNDSVNTLELRVDEVGLFYRFEIDEEISYQKDLYRNIQKGNISKSSFAFRIAEDGEEWEKRDGMYVRTITAFKGIYDVSPVTNPAYSDTSVRNLDEVKEKLGKKGFNYEYLIKYNQLRNNLL